MVFLSPMKTLLFGDFTRMGFQESCSQKHLDCPPLIIYTARWVFAIKIIESCAVIKFRETKLWQNWNSWKPANVISRKCSMSFHTKVTNSIILTDVIDIRVIKDLLAP